MKRLCFVVLLVLGCVVLIDSVRQPAVVGPGEEFTITVTGTFDLNGTGWLGIMLPNGVRADSLRYLASDGDSALLTEADSTLCAWLTGSFPCESDMHWAGFSYNRVAAVDSFISYVALVYVEATDSAVPGQYAVDYRSGRSQPWNCTDSVLDVSLTVTSLGVAESTSRLSVSWRVWPSVFRDRLSISVPESDAVGVYDATGRFVRMLRVEKTGSWDGTDERGRRVPAGAYLVRGEHVQSRVTLLE